MICYFLWALVHFTVYVYFRWRTHADYSPFYGLCVCFLQGVEVHGSEWTFASGGGVFSHSPKDAQGAPLRVSIRIGETSASSQEVATLISGMRPDWPGSRYNVIKW